ncbi:MAG: alginate lyase family protein [Hyphomicrobium sp.]
MVRRSFLPASLMTAAVALTPAAAACDLPPPPVRDLALERYYADDAGSVVDPARLKAQRRASAPVRDYLEHVVADADASLRAATPSLGKYRALCAIDWLDAWSRGEALLGTIDGKQSEAERRWTLAGTALAYLKVKAHASDEQREVIAGWLVKLADKARAAFDQPGVKRNNHAYWLGLGLAATGLAVDSSAHWDAARGIMQEAASDIRPDGALPLELARGPRALHYHAFAAMPLVTLTELARRRGEDWYAFGNGAVGRLVDLTARGLADPAVFDDLAGVLQQRPVKTGAGWMPLYAASHPAWTVPPIEMASGHRWLGGNVLLLAGALSEGAK